ncbi:MULTISPECIES: Holliday junction branch migration protein RuvA [Tissierellales]|uniref:Holliday junction branch migration complex subunit RuvA n=1 Tax=Acidilutibacter cellobiosedens TaxID=2507161 RepID=A0A410QC07_9FIRM|nr:MULTISPECIES: Holliday junction branch migration protein RuvA [Tissierellales]MBE6083337.1 Holliday junction branch migration protein RuvA [Tissierellaceae bacterium]QAT61384.1 Holliday junction branch migration protein RuvA [Acidilutibacter cellobiosedens]SCL95636.1 Holliday junction ATP-dependent DNA helicase RuvA [Sporanaerobacter sp. PP17-6a]
MFEYIKGCVTFLGEDYLVLENKGIGYRIYTSKNSIAKVSNTKDEIKVFTYLNLREDGIYLYGFYDYEELNMFKMLLLVSKIGPKMALGLLSSLTVNDIKSAIFNNNPDLLSRAPGIGKKTAGRIILELKDRIDSISIDEVKIGGENRNIDDAVSALLSLGYTRNEINNVFSQMELGNLKTEDIIKLSIKKLLKN